MSNCNKGCGSSSIEASEYGCEEAEDGLHNAACITSSPCATTPSSSCCTPSVPAQPYYTAVKLCPEDCADGTVIQTISQLYKNDTSFAMPACGESVSVVFSGVTEAAIGAYLWAGGIGFLKITGFNADTHSLTLQNPCPTGQCVEQLTSGAFIAGNTPFILTIEPCDVDQAGGILGLFPYLASGFLSPSNGNCVEIATTNVNGLSANRLITLAGGTYRIDAILSGTSMRICNDGAGLPAGVTVDYVDTNGTYINPIVLIDSNPCSNPESLAGLPVVCDSGILSPLVGTQDGQILVYDHSAGAANFRTLGIPTLNCTDLTICLTLDPALTPGTPYLTTVSDTSGFSPGDVINILLSEFTVDSIVNGTQMYIIPVVHPGAIQTYPPGTTVCAADCCTINSERIDTVETSLSNIITRYTANQRINGGQRNAANVGVAESAPLASPIAISVAGNSAVGNVAALTITNASLVYTMKVHITVMWQWWYRLDGALNDGAEIVLAGYYGYGAFGGALALSGQLPQSHYHRPLIGGNIARHSNSWTTTYTETVPVNTTRQATARANLIYNIDAMGVGVYADFLISRISAIGVAVD